MEKYEAVGEIVSSLGVALIVGPQSASDARVQWLDMLDAIVVLLRARKCGAGGALGLSCDREAGHQGDHRGYIEQHDEVLFWRTN